MIIDQLIIKCSRDGDQLTNPWSQEHLQDSVVLVSDFEADLEFRTRLWSSNIICQYLANNIVIRYDDYMYI